eukprot:TRINITY_DN6374_c0_g1_i2.p1 TRINITY_DN6374_c0_g1~~TRINITY_DN6374_c0_g1_i2.p1  ORF type:complete len:209 (+),score=4.63 TRINITY_DN6374_c0_g1_i2:198-824(+)
MVTQYRNKSKFFSLSLQNIYQTKYSLLFLLFCLATLTMCKRANRGRTRTPKIYPGINPAYIAPKQKILDAEFDKKHILKIDTSNIDSKYAALCVITKNDNIYDVWEFLNYHFKIGIGRIYLYDTGTNNSKQLNGIFELFSEFFANGRMYYQYWNLPPSKLGVFNMQENVYNICAKDFAKGQTIRNNLHRCVIRSLNPCMFATLTEDGV